MKRLLLLVIVALVCQPERSEKHIAKERCFAALSMTKGGARYDKGGAQHDRMPSRGLADPLESPAELV